MCTYEQAMIIILLFKYHCYIFLKCGYACKNVDTCTSIVQMGKVPGIKVFYNNYYINYLQISVFGRLS